MKIRRAGLFILSIALSLGTSGFALNPTTSAFNAVLNAVSQREGVAAQLSAERITKHVQFLASDKLQGRRAGTPAADEAAAYIEKEFRSYGLKTASSAVSQPFSFVQR